MSTALASMWLLVADVGVKNARCAHFEDVVPDNLLY